MLLKPFKIEFEQVNDDGQFVIVLTTAEKIQRQHVLERSIPMLRVGMIMNAVGELVVEAIKDGLI
jgi:hypothetical protein